ncbi:MAG: TonB-dependent receptor [Reichenbachiella sp.]
MNYANFNLLILEINCLFSKKSIQLFMISMLIGTSVFAQPYTQTVKGKITDVDTGIELIGARIILVDSEPILGAISDMNGNFKLENIPTGRKSFSISYLGYEEVFLNEIVVSSGHQVTINVKLQESLTQLEEVVVVASSPQNEAINTMATVSARQVTVEATSRIAAGFNDPARTVQSYAGVSSTDDENNELVIRGNSPRGMLWRMEGIEIPNPNHFSNGEGGSGGGVSALSSQVLASSDFFSSAFPSEYGNALSGVFDLRLRNGNFDKRQHSVQLGVLGAQIATEGPFKKGSEASYLINYRYSTLEGLAAMGIDISGGDIVPTFQDLSYKVSVPTKKAGTFSIWGLGGTSSAGSTVVEDSSQWMYRGDAYRDNEDHNLAINGITHQFNFANNRTYIKTVAAYSFSENIMTVDSLDYNYNSAITEDENFKYNTFNISSFINHKFNPKSLVRFGAIYTQPRYDFYARELNYDSGVLETLVDESGKTSMVQSYLQWKYRVSETVEVNTGLHYTQLLINNNFSIEPRIGLRWNVNNNSAINFGAGLHSKSEPISIYLAEQTLQNGEIINPNKDLEITKSLHFVVGYDLNFAKDFNFKTEVYYQHLYDVPVSSSDTTGTFSSLNFSSGYTNEALVSEGTGRNYGIEFTLEKYFSNSYYLLATASLFESKYTMPDGVERNTRFNGNYITNLVGGKEFQIGKNKQNVIGINLKLNWRGGYKTIPIDLAASELQNEEVRDYNQAFETKSPDYFRVDLGVSYRKNKPNWAWVLSADIQNITGRLNINGQYYSSETGNVEFIYMNGLIPVINYRLEF